VSDIKDGHRTAANKSVVGLGESPPNVKRCISEESPKPRHDHIIATSLFINTF